MCDRNIESGRQEHCPAISPHHLSWGSASGGSRLVGRVPTSPLFLDTEPHRHTLVSIDVDQTSQSGKPISTDSPPALWNPNAAACWSLVFSPAFGAFLHARNAQSLGRTDEAKANRTWFYASFGYFGFVLISIFIPAIPNAVFSVAALGILFGW
jgi:hypothetical protein